MPVKVVTIGGGTGHYRLLRALRLLVPKIEITAVVSMADSGGSSGMLRDEIGALPPGDLRQCLLALTRHPEEVARRILADRIPAEPCYGKLAGHNFGNLILGVLPQWAGNPLDVIAALEWVLEVAGRVLPVTVGNITLRGESRKGAFVNGEANFDMLDQLLNSDDQIARVWLEPNALVLGEAAEALRKADYVVLSPGDLFSSVIPVLMVQGVSEALASSHAKLVYLCNLVTTRGQTDRFTVTDFVHVLQCYLPRPLDTVIYHNRELDEDRAQRYAETDHAFPVVCKVPHGLEGCQVLGTDLLAKGVLVRHDIERVALMLGIIMQAGLPTGRIAAVVPAGDSAR